MSLPKITLDSILNSEIPLKDKFWFVCKKLATKEQNQQIAIFCAETVLHIYENKYPNDKRPREAIQAAKDYLAGKISVSELQIKRAAADDAVRTAATKVIGDLDGLEPADREGIDEMFFLDERAEDATRIAAKPVTFRATVENLFDKSYWAGSFNDNFATTGGPRTVRVSATVDF